MKICPFINECKKQVLPDWFKSYCKVSFLTSLINSYKDCHMYSALYREKTEQTPKKWLDEE